MSVVVERSFHLADNSGRKGGFRRSLQVGSEPSTPKQAPPAPVGRVPRISRLMALAIPCEQILRSGAVPDASALARLAHVSQPRMTQILNLTLLAPDIQERLLFLDPVEEGKPEVNGKGLRKLCAEMAWERQRTSIDQSQREPTLTRDADYFSAPRLNPNAPSRDVSMSFPASLNANISSWRMIRPCAIKGSMVVEMAPPKDGDRPSLETTSTARHSPCIMICRIIKVSTSARDGL